MTTASFCRILSFFFFFFFYYFFLACSGMSTFCTFRDEHSRRVSGLPNSSVSSWFILLLHTPGSHIPPTIVLNTPRSNMASALASCIDEIGFSGPAGPTNPLRTVCHPVSFRSCWALTLLRLNPRQEIHKWQTETCRGYSPKQDEKVQLMTLQFVDINIVSSIPFSN